VEPHDGLIGIGSGGFYALACARGLIDLPGWTAEEIAKKSMRVAAELCIYTNDRFVMDILTIDKSISRKRSGQENKREDKQTDKEKPPEGEQKSG